MATKELSQSFLDYQSLSAGSRQLAALAANLGDEKMNPRDLQKVKTPSGGSLKWSLMIQGNEETTDEIVGCLVSFEKQGTIWSSAQASENSWAVISSTDLITGYRVSDDLGEISPDSLEKYRTGDRTYDWVKLSTSPEFGFGSAGLGRRCKECLVLTLLRKDEMWPVVIKAPPTSFQSAWTFCKQLSVPHWEAVVGVSLTTVKNAKGQSFSATKLRLVGCISPEQGEMVRTMYTLPIQAASRIVPSITAKDMPPF